jgi:hypothetical protein
LIPVISNPVKIDDVQAAEGHQTQTDVSTSKFAASQNAVSGAQTLTTTSVSTLYSASSEDSSATDISADPEVIESVVDQITNDVKRFIEKYSVEGGIAINSSLVLEGYIDLDGDGIAQANELMETLTVGEDYRIQGLFSDVWEVVIIRYQPDFTISESTGWNFLADTVYSPFEGFLDWRVVETGVAFPNE